MHVCDFFLSPPKLISEGVTIFKTSSVFLLRRGYPSKLIDYHSKICMQKLAMFVRGSVISLAGSSQCEPCVDIILREGVICL